MALLDSRHAVASDLQVQTRAIADILNRSELVIKNNHKQAKLVIVDALAVRLSNFDNTSLSL